MADANIFGIIAGKFCYKKKLYLVIPFKINKDLKIGFYCIILLFNQIIHFWIKNSGKFLLNAKEIV